MTLGFFHLPDDPEWLNDLITGFLYFADKGVLVYDHEGRTWKPKEYPEATNQQQILAKMIVRDLATEIKLKMKKADG